MEQTNELSIERKLELEEELQKHSSEHKDLATLLLIHNLVDAKYLLEAIYMPIDDMINHIYRYDTITPKLDELVFVSELAKRYKVSEKDIIKRIKTAREINKLLYEKSHLVKNKKK